MDAARLVVDNPALLTDLYQLTMVQAYWRERMLEEAVFSLFVRRLPESRNFLIACGTDDALGYLESLRFTRESVEYLAGRPEFRQDFLDWLEGFRFTGEVRAVPEGTAIFANEPILEVSAPLPEAQLVETLLLNQIHLQTTLASKAARVVLAADGRPVVDFGMRRMHGTDAAMKGARAFYIAGVAGTSNVLAGLAYRIPVSGTMAHSYIQVHDSELEAFRAFSALYPETILLVDTYDSIEGVHHVVRLSQELGAGFRVRAVRLDSGDLEELAVAARGILDDAGLHQVQVFASGSLDEYEVERLVESGTPIDAFGVGTAMGVSSDAPSLDIVYKLTEYGGRGRIKLSTGKVVLPGRKQIFRRDEAGLITGDVIAIDGEVLPGRALLEPVMRGGRRLATASRPLDALRDHAARELAALPPPLRRLTPADPAYRVDLSEQLRQDLRRLTDDVRRVEYA